MKTAGKSPAQEAASSLWNTCEGLTAITPRVPVVGQAWSHTRSVTWTEYPNRYMLKEFDETRPSRILRRPRTEPSMFQLSSLSAEQTATGLVTLSQYFIGRQGVLGAFHSELPHWTRLTDEDKQGMANASRFIIENGLFAPNGEDSLRVEFALSRGVMDGVEAYVAA